MRLFAAPRSPARTLLLPLAFVAFAACEDEATAPDDSFEEGTVALDASSPAAFAYLSLGGGGQVVTPADPSASTEWDLAFRRFSARLNGGVSGPGSVSAVSLGSFEGATSDQVVALTRTDADAAFEAVTEADIPAASAFRMDGLAPDPGASWFRFDGQSGTLVANPGAAWKVQGGQGGFSVFRVAVLNMAGQAPLGATVEYRQQDAGGALGPIQTVDVDFAQGPGYLDFSTGSVVAPAGCAWDIAMMPSLMIDVNADCGAGTFPLDATDDFTALSQADDAPEYGGFLSTISGAFPASVDDASGVFWYNIEGNQRLWPTFNVYLVNTPTGVYKVQILDYYNATGQSGFPTVRFQQLR